MTLSLPTAAATVVGVVQVAAAMVATAGVAVTEVGGCGGGYGGAYGGYYGPGYGFGNCLPVPVPIVGCW